MNFNINGKQVCWGWISINFSVLTAEWLFIDTQTFFAIANMRRLTEALESYWDAPDRKYAGTGW